MESQTRNRLMQGLSTRFEVGTRSCVVNKGDFRERHFVKVCDGHGAGDMANVGAHYARRDQHHTKEFEVDGGS